MKCRWIRTVFAAGMMLVLFAGCGSLSAAATLTQEAERISAAAETPGEMTASVSAAIRRKAPEGSFRAEDLPGGVGGTVQATISIE